MIQAFCLILEWMDFFRSFILLSAINPRAAAFQPRCGVAASIRARAAVLCFRLSRILDWKCLTSIINSALPVNGKFS